MKIKLEVLLSCLLLTLSVFVYGQDRRISGRILEETGQPLIGATVIVEGTLRTGIVGTSSDRDGNFVINVPAGRDSLTFSFTGYLTKTIYIGQQQFVEVALMPAPIDLEGFVVTALGIRREQKALGYAVTSVDGDMLRNKSRVSPINALAGFAPGLQISASGGGAGGSTKILIRGVSSLTGTNDPLIVLDGVPISSGGGATGTQFGGFDFGSAINNISLDDIENITVLRGGAATALYGSRGQNGVILISTRSGREELGLGISFTTSFSVDNPLIKPVFQNSFSQGSALNFEQLGTRSWGARMAGQQVTNFLGQRQNLLENPEHPYEFFRQGTNFDQTISIDRRGEDNSVFFSASWNQSNGIIPTNNFDRKSFTLRYESNLSDFVSFSGRANYINQEVLNRPNLAGSPDNPIYLMIKKPRSVSLDQLRTFRTIDGLPVVWNSLYRQNPDGSVVWDLERPAFASSPLLQNPFWAVNLNTNRDLRHRLIGFGEMNVDFGQWLALGFDLDLRLRVAMDFFSDDRQQITATNTYYKSGGLASGFFNTSESLERNYDFLLTFGDTWGDFSTIASIGGNVMHASHVALNSSSEAGLINPLGPYVIQNFRTIGSAQGYSRREIQSIYGVLSSDWRRTVFLELTMRNDWTSVLAPENWSFFYPSISATWLLEETFDLPQFVDLLKLRASWAGIGNAGNFASPRFFQYGTNPNQYLGHPFGFINAIRPNYFLLPEYTISSEFGVQTVLFNSRLNLDLSYYDLGTSDQIFFSPIAPSSGHNIGLINSGYIQNRGIELSLSKFFPVNDDLSVNLSGNFTRQWNSVRELAEGIELLNLGGIHQGVFIAARYGHPVGQIMGTAFDRDEQGRIILDDLSLPRIRMTPQGAINTENVIGNAYPDILWGLNASITFRQFNIGFMIDSQLGHEIYSLTNQRGTQFGTLAITEVGRAEWMRALEIANITGVPPADGLWITGVRNGIEGTFPVNPQSYWERLSRIDEAFIYDASFIRLRSISLNYNFSSDLISQLGIRELGISLFANNVAYLLRNTENISPESSFSTGNAVGFEMFSYPELRTIGMSLRVVL